MSGMGQSGGYAASCVIALLLGACTAFAGAKGGWSRWSLVAVALVPAGLVWVVLPTAWVDSVERGSGVEVGPIVNSAVSILASALLGAVLVVVRLRDRTAVAAARGFVPWGALALALAFWLAATCSELVYHAELVRRSFLEFSGSVRVFEDWYPMVSVSGPILDGSLGTSLFAGVNCESDPRQWQIPTVLWALRADCLLVPLVALASLAVRRSGIARVLLAVAVGAAGGVVGWSLLWMASSRSALMQSHAGTSLEGQLVLVTVGLAVLAVVVFSSLAIAARPLRLETVAFCSLGAGGAVSAVRFLLGSATKQARFLPYVREQLLDRLHADYLVLIAAALALAVILSWRSTGEPAKCSRGAVVIAWGGLALAVGAFLLSVTRSG